MFKWLKNFFSKHPITPDLEWPFPIAKGQDQSTMAPYKVEPQITDAVTQPASTPAKKPSVKKAPATKRKPAPAGKTAPRRGRKPKAKPAQ
jgi:hypothetical protein